MTNRLSRLVSLVRSPASRRLLRTVASHTEPFKFKPIRLGSVSCIPRLTRRIPKLGISSVSGDSGDPVTSPVTEVPAAKQIPVEFSRNVMVLSCESTADGGTCDVYVVGTSHVSKKSCREVEAVIRSIKPQVVFLELCKKRDAVLTQHSLEVPTIGQMLDKLRKNHSMFVVIYSWFMAKVASTLEVVPGAEFRVAYEEANKYGGKVILGDRPVEITVKRTMARMPFRQKFKLMYSLCFQASFTPSSKQLKDMLKEMDCMDAITLTIQQLSKEFPSLIETIVHERDRYMSAKLLEVAKEHSSVVAVVGKGHLPGIKKHWKQPVQLEELLEMPEQKPALLPRNMVASIGVGALGAVIVYKLLSI